MDKKEIDNIKEQMISKLKEEIESSMQEKFVENYEEWQVKLKSVNDVISYVDPDVIPYNYNDFCKKIIEITKDSLDNFIEYDKLFLTSSEYFNIMEENKGDEEKAQKALLEELNRKFMYNVMIILNKKNLMESVRYKLKEKFYLVEEELNNSFEIAKLIMKKHKKENE